MEQVIRRFNIITLRPHWAQYIISQGLMFLVSMVLFLVAGHEAITFKAPFLILGTITTLMMLYGCLYLCKLRFIVSSEQLITSMASSIGQATTLSFTASWTSARAGIYWNSCSD